MNRLLTVREASVQLGITARAVRLWIDSGRLPAQRVDGKYGKEWRLDPQDVARAASLRTDAPLALDLAHKPAGSDLRSLVSIFDSDLRNLQTQQSDHSQQLQQISEKLDALPAALLRRPEDPLVQGLIRQGSQVQQTVEEESRARRREAQELQASLQALGAAVRDQTERLARLGEDLAALRSRPLPWYRRLFSSSPPGEDQG